MKIFLKQTIKSLQVAENNIMFVNMPVSGILTKMTASVKDNVSSTNTFDAHLNGTTIFSNQADRPSITTGNDQADNGGTLAQSVSIGDEISIDADVVNETLSFLEITFEIIVAEILQNSQSAAYTCVLEDAGKHIYHPSTDNNARTFTIPANSSVPYPVGVVITFVNEINVVTIAINTDTLVLAGTSSTGSRSLAAGGLATAIKVTSTRWIISGAGLS